jgi:hypothetical protein
MSRQRCLHVACLLQCKECAAHTVSWCGCVQARLHAMEGKILKGAARGGLVELTRLKEEQLKRREVELQRRYVLKQHVWSSTRLPVALHNRLHSHGL